MTDSRVNNGGHNHLFKHKISFDDKDYTLLQRYQTERNVKNTTMKGLTSAISTFMNYTGKHIHDILDTCQEEQKMNLNPNNLTIKKILEDYRKTLMDKHMAPTTVHTYWSRAGTFFRHFNIYVPPLNQIQMKQDDIIEVTYDDLPDKNCIRMACDYSERYRPYFLFSSSSGTARAECLSITVRMLLKGCEDYIDDKDANIKEQIYQLMQRTDVIPLLRLKRRKTYKTYYTCCSPEAAYYVNKGLYQRSKLELDDKIFPWKDSMIITAFQRVNDHFGWGYVGKYRRFRSHMMRKFHASNLGCDPFIIDRLEGRSKNKLHETYIKTNPRELRKIYSKYMHNVIMYPERWDCPGLNTDEKNKKVYEFTDLSKNVKHQKGVSQQPVQQNNNMDVNVYIEIGKLQQRIDELEQEVKELKK